VEVQSEGTDKDHRCPHYFLVLIAICPQRFLVFIAISDHEDNPHVVPIISPHLPEEWGGNNISFWGSLHAHGWAAEAGYD
jgi:hypothetical protein